MIREQSKEWMEYLSEAFKHLTDGECLSFAKITPSKIPMKSGVYVISAKKDNKEIPYYVGRSKNLRQRLYSNHLMGPFSNARLKKYLVNSKECTDISEAKKFIKANCVARWFIENNVRKRGAVEGYVTGVLFPKYGIYEEH
jgi:predicted GIY-YIG superfamily endonuclease